MIIKVIAKGFIALTGCICLSQTDYSTQRATMVETQLVSRNIYDRTTLKAMRTVPRHRFVPEALKPLSYSDGPLSIGEGQTISQPFIVAYMTQSLGLKKDSKVLEIGTGSGYQAAILAQITNQVYTIEIVPSLALKSRELLQDLGYNPIKFKIGDGYNGWEEYAPFDAIIVTAGAEEIPRPLLEQLADGGRMIIPVGPHRGVRQLVRVDKRKGKFQKKNLMAVRFVPFTRKKQQN